MHKITFLQSSKILFPQLHRPVGQTGCMLKCFKFKVTKICSTPFYTVAKFCKNIWKQDKILIWKNLWGGHTNPQPLDVRGLKAAWFFSSPTEYCKCSPESIFVCMWNEQNICWQNCSKNIFCSWCNALDKCYAP